MTLLLGRPRTGLNPGRPSPCLVFVPRLDHACSGTTTSRVKRPLLPATLFVHEPAALCGDGALRARPPVPPPRARRRATQDVTGRASDRAHARQHEAPEATRPITPAVHEGSPALVGHPMQRTRPAAPATVQAPSIPSTESTREQDPSDDLFHEPEAQPKTVTAEALSRNHPTRPPAQDERLPVVIQARSRRLRRAGIGTRRCLEPARPAPGSGCKVTADGQTPRSTTVFKPLRCLHPAELGPLGAGLFDVKAVLYHLAILREAAIPKFRTAAPLASRVMRRGSPPPSVSILISM
jgi:hypothetical protein